MTPDQELAKKKRLVSAARASLSMEIGLTVGAFRISNALRSLGEDYETRHRIFRDFTSAIPPEIPLGTARLYWVPHLLMEWDSALAEIEGRFRKALLEECIVIIDIYGRTAGCRGDQHL